MKKFYKVKEFANIVGVSRATLRNWDNKDILKADRNLTNQRIYYKRHINKALKISNKINIDNISLDVVSELFKDKYYEVFQDILIDKIVGIDNIDNVSSSEYKDLPTKTARVVVKVDEKVKRFEIKTKEDKYIFQIKSIEYHDKYFKNRLDIDIIDFE